VGTYLPTFAGSIEADGGVPPFTEIVAVARELEAAGLDSLWVADELNPVLSDGSVLGYWESWTILAALARETTRVRLGPLVASIGFRNPGLLAKMAVTLDDVCGGRLALGIGAGYDEGEHTMFGMPWAARVGRLEEYLAILRGLLDGEVVAFEGLHHTVQQARLDPPPRRRVTIVVGTIAIGPRLMDAVASHADGWNVWLAFDDNRPTALARHVEALDAACQRVGRDPKSIERSVGISLRLSGRRFRLGPDDYTDIALAGTDDEIAERITEFGRYGVDEVVLYTLPLGRPEMARLARIVELVRA
jgi:alkanesulfonate monooxygenase SsuD/methylene tetrahydromethanopterin reductase-like flavin-dependent oxidoreductase (luciferase family)